MTYKIEVKFELRISGDWGNCSTNWATTTALDKFSLLQLHLVLWLRLKQFGKFTLGTFCFGHSLEHHLGKQCSSKVDPGKKIGRLSFDLNSSGPVQLTRWYHNMQQICYISCSETFRILQVTGKAATVRNMSLRVDKKVVLHNQWKEINVFSQSSWN